jgi:hypothetical protein
MRQNDGIGSDNMTVIIVDFLQNSGGCNGKSNIPVDKVMSSSFGKATNPYQKQATGTSGAVGVSSQKLGTKQVRR